jgi:hypothetical protein
MRDCSNTLKPALTVGEVCKTIRVLFVCHLATIEIGSAFDRCTAWRGPLQLVLV